MESIEILAVVESVSNEKGIEEGLDWQTTRTFMGNTFPGPGLHSKFYDTDHEPLVEVIRDTVGKHDTFNLACS